MAYKALVIDDDKVTLDLLTFQLQSEGFETVAAETGEEGLRHVRETDFDIILTDLNLPDISGIDMSILGAIILLLIVRMIFGRGGTTTA